MDINAPAEITEGTLLGGRLRYNQPKLGFRSGIEPVFLAAMVPARAGERVLKPAAAPVPPCFASPPESPASLL